MFLTMSRLPFDKVSTGSIYQLKATALALSPNKPIIPKGDTIRELLQVATDRHPARG